MVTTPPPAPPLQLLGNLEVRGGKRPMAVTLAVDLRGRLLDARSEPPRPILPPHSIGNWAIPAKSVVMDPATATLGEQRSHRTL